MLGSHQLNLQVAETKLAMRKENWLKYVMWQKDKLERVLNEENDKKFLNYHTYFCIFF